MTHASAAGDRQGPTTVSLYDRWSNHRSRPDSAISWAHNSLAVHPERIAFLDSCLSVSSIQQFDYSRALARDLAQDCAEFDRRTDGNLNMKSI
jgi:hypothetical protein